MCPKANIRWIDMNEIIITNEQPKQQTEQQQQQPIQPSVIQPSVIQPSVIQPTIIDELPIPEVKKSITEKMEEDINNRLEEMMTPYKQKISEYEQKIKMNTTIKRPRKFDFSSKSLFDFGAFNPNYLIACIGLIAVYFMK